MCTCCSLWRLSTIPVPMQRRRRRRPYIKPCIDTLGVANLSLACQPCAPPVTLQSRPPPWIPRTFVCELSSSSLHPILAVRWRLAVRTRRVAEAKHRRRVFCAAEASLQSSACELVEYMRAAAAYSVSQAHRLLSLQ